MANDYVVMPDVSSSDGVEDYSPIEHPAEIFKKCDVSKHNTRYIDNNRLEDYQVIKDIRAHNEGQQRNRDTYQNCVDDELDESVSVPLDTPKSNESRTKMKDFKRTRLQIPSTPGYYSKQFHLPTELPPRPRNKSIKLGQQHLTQNKTPLSNFYSPKRSCNENSEKLNFKNLRDARRQSMVDKIKQRAKVQEILFDQSDEDIGGKQYQSHQKPPRLEEDESFEPQIDREVTSNKHWHQQRKFRLPRGHYKYRRKNDCNIAQYDYSREYCQKILKKTAESSTNKSEKLLDDGQKEEVYDYSAKPQFQIASDQTFTSQTSWKYRRNRGNRLYQTKTLEKSGFALEDEFEEICESFEAKIEDEPSTTTIVNQPEELSISCGLPLSANAPKLMTDIENSTKLVNYNMYPDKIKHQGEKDLTSVCSRNISKAFQDTNSIEMLEEIIVCHQNDSNGTSSMDSFLINNKWLLDEGNHHKIQVVDRYHKNISGSGEKLNVHELDSVREENE